jgi:hypothetical protein
MTIGIGTYTIHTVSPGCHAMKLSRSPGSGHSIAASWPEADSVM